MLITCPHCGDREVEEFSYGGDASIKRPVDPAAASDTEWDNFIYWRENRKGPHAELWHHAAGCRLWFKVVRNTLNHEIEETTSQTHSAVHE